jgi:hypothetical protein
MWSARRVLIILSVLLCVLSPKARGGKETKKKNKRRASLKRRHLKQVGQWPAVAGKGGWPENAAAS